MGAYAIVLLVYPLLSDGIARQFAVNRPGNFLLNTPLVNQRRNRVAVSEQLGYEETRIADLACSFHMFFLYRAAFLMLPDERGACATEKSSL